MKDEFLPPSEIEPEKDPKRVSNSRLAIWIIVAGVGIYLLGSGVWGIVNGG